ncbi:MAG: hypothetical protein M9936_28630 [Caldilinea sp.]|nr:hypothetical protein [Caldilinea sp.]
MFGYLIDFATNVLVCTRLLEPSHKETTVTARLSRHKKAGGWRGSVATWVGDHLLDPFDPDGSIRGAMADELTEARFLNVKKAADMVFKQ